MICNQPTWIILAGPTRTQGPGPALRHWQPGLGPGPGQNARPGRSAGAWQDSQLTRERRVTGTLSGPGWHWQLPLEPAQSSDSDFNPDSGPLAP